MSINGGVQGDTGQCVVRAPLCPQPQPARRTVHAYIWTHYKQVLSLFARTRNSGGGSAGVSAIDTATTGSQAHPPPAELRLQYLYKPEHDYTLAGT